MSTQHASQRPTRTQGAPRSRRAGSSRPAAGTPGAVGSTRASSTGSTGGSTGASRASTRAHSGRTRAARLEPVTASQSVVRPASTAASHGGKRTSTNASRVPSSVRAAARTEETREEKPKQRNPLSTVRRRARKLSPPTMLAVFAAIPLTLIFILLLNVLIVTRQYDMVDLRAQEQQLVQENQALQQEIGFKEAPQDLAIRASTLGMFVSSSQATLNLQSSTIEGTPTPAASPTGAEGSKQENLISPPAAGSNESYAKSIVDADKSVQQRHGQASAAAKASASASASPAQQANNTQQANPAQPAPSASASPASSAAPSAAQQPSPATSPAASQAAR